MARPYQMVGLSSLPARAFRALRGGTTLPDGRIVFLLPRRAPRPKRTTDPRSWRLHRRSQPVSCGSRLPDGTGQHGFRCPPLLCRNSRLLEKRRIRRSSCAEPFPFCEKRWGLLGCKSPSHIVPHLVGVPSENRAVPSLERDRGVFVCCNRCRRARKGRSLAPWRRRR